MVSEGVRRARGLPWSLVSTLAVLSLALALPRLVPGLDLDREFSVDVSRVGVEVAPGWFEAGGQEELARSLAALGTVSLRSDRQLKALIDVVERSSPWISRVSQAQKVYPDRLAISLELRRPVALVHASRGRFLVDSDGFVLASADRFPRMLEETRPLLVFREGTPPRLEVGEKLDDPVLEAGVRVAADLEPHLARLRRRGIDLVLVDVSPMALGSRDRLTDVNLYTPDGFFVQWGRAESRSDEPSVTTKLRVLESAWEVIPPFEDVIGICVQFPSVPTFVTRNGSSLASLGGAVENSYR